MKPRAGQSHQRLGATRVFLCWAPITARAPFPKRRVGFRTDQASSPAQRTAAALYAALGPRHGRLRLRPKRRPQFRSAKGRRYAFSMSHSDGVVMLAWAQGFNLRLGVDLERSTRKVRPGLARKLPWNGQGLPYGHLTANWTALEAALKADGRGLSGLGKVVATGNPWRLDRLAPGQGTLLLAPLKKAPRGFRATLALGKTRA